MKRIFVLALTAVALVLMLALAAPAATVSCSGVAAWSGNSVSYSAGTLVTYNGSEYKCLQSHTSQAGWDPADVPALWSLQGTCSSGGGGGATPTPTPKGATPTPTPVSGGGGGGGNCAPTWSATAIYTGGMTASLNGENYQAAYWTQGNNPSTSSGPAGSGQPWIPEGSCSGSGGGGSTPTPTAKPTPTTSGGGGGGGGKTFAPYADISLASGENIVSNASAAGLHAVTLAFLVDGGCTATWGGLGGSVSGASFPNGTSVSSAINSLISNGVKVFISWGGANGSIASSCSGAGNIQAMYQSVFNAYPNISGQDFDIEGGIDTTAVGQALAGLKNANPSKQISLTLPVLPTGLVSAGLSIVNACHSAGFQPDTVNVMAMDYGSGTDGLSSGATMAGDAENAGSSTHSQTGNNIGITPMIGVNDTNTEVFQLGDASSLVSWANGQGYVNRLAFWSLGRDNGGCAGSGFASATCSSISQSNFQFSGIFNGF